MAFSLNCLIVFVSFRRVIVKILSLKHLIVVPRVQGVVYATRSVFNAENESVVQRAIEYINLVQQKKTPFRVSPPVIPLSEKDIEEENPLSGKFLKFPASYAMSGCFVATITREVSPLAS